MHQIKDTFRQRQQHQRVRLLANADHAGQSVLDNGELETSQRIGCDASRVVYAGRCRRHHRAVREEGARLARDTEGALVFYRPNGWVLPQVPEAPTVPVDPIGEVRENAANGLDRRASSEGESSGNGEDRLARAVDKQPRAVTL